MTNIMSENVASVTGGIIGSVIGLVTVGTIVDCAIFAFVGGTIGYFAKLLWTYIVGCIKCEYEKRKKHNHKHKK